MKSLLLATTLALGTVAGPAGAEIVSELRRVKGNAKQEYFLIGPKDGQAPRGGFKLLLVMPGGPGTAEFNPFVTNMARHALGEDYIVAQLVAVNWNPQQRIIWPTAGSKVDGMKFTTEEFLQAVIDEVKDLRTIDADHIYTLSWSSSGPAAYAASLLLEPIRGSFVAMSVFKPDSLPNLAKAKGHRYYIYHSPDDKVCPLRMAEEAREKLTEHKAKVKFTTYDGGHGWHGNPFAAIREGMNWLTGE